MGISLIFKTSTTTNFAQGSIAALGCYFTTYLACELEFLSHIAVGLVVGILFGLFVDAVIFRAVARSMRLVNKLLPWG